MGGKETVECQIEFFSFNNFYKTVDNKVIKFSLNLTGSAFNNLTNLMHFFILTLLHTASKIGMYGLLYILTYSL